MLQDITAIANNIRNTTPENSLPVSPCSSALAVLATPVSSTSENGNATERQSRSEVWLHFVKAPDYKTSRKAICTHCNTTFKATGGTTTSMIAHLKTKHPDKLTVPDGVKSLDR